jgi:hypothetical protein
MRHQRPNQKQPLIHSCASCGSRYEAVLEQQRSYAAFKAIGHASDPFVQEECPSCP